MGTAAITLADQPFRPTPSVGSPNTCSLHRRPTARPADRSATSCATPSARRSSSPPWVRPLCPGRLKQTAPRRPPPLGATATSSALARTARPWPPRANTRTAGPSFVLRARAAPVPFRRALRSAPPRSPTGFLSGRTGSPRRVARSGRTATRPGGAELPSTPGRESGSASLRGRARHDRLCEALQPAPGRAAERGPGHPLDPAPSHQGDHDRFGRLNSDILSRCPCPTHSRARSTWSPPT